MSAYKSVPLTKDEVKLFIELLEGQPIIISKATNSTNNKLKDVAWRRLTKEFNASVSTGPRKPEQLRLKWKNLTKAARKRVTAIKANNFKTGGGKPDYIPPDDNLDHVASILGSTCKGLPVEFGGDAENDILGKTSSPNEPSSLVSNDLLGDSHSIDDLEEVNEETLDFAHRESGGGSIDVVVENTMGDTSDFTPRGYRFMRGSKRSSGKPRQRSQDDKSLEIRNKMIAEYYSVKKRKVELDIEEKLLNNEKIKLDLENLKLANEILKKELESK